MLSNKKNSWYKTVRFFKFVILSLLSIGLLIVVVLPFFINSDFLKSYIGEKSGLVINWSDLAINPLNQTLSVQKVVVSDSSSIKLTFSLTSLNLQIDLFALLQKKVILKKISLDSPNLFLDQKYLDQLDSSKHEPTPQDSSKQSMDLQILDLNITDISLEYQQSDTLLYKFKGKKISSYIDLKRQFYQINLLSNQAEIVKGKEIIPLGVLNLKATLKNDTLQTEQFEVKTANSEIDIAKSNVLLNPKTPLDFAISGKINLNEPFWPNVIKQFFPSDNSSLIFKLKSAGNLENPYLKLELLFNKVTLDKLVLTNANINLTLKDYLLNLAINIDDKIQKRALNSQILIQTKNGFPHGFFQEFDLNKLKYSGKIIIGNQLLTPYLALKSHPFKNPIKLNFRAVGVDLDKLAGEIDISTILSPIIVSDLAINSLVNFESKMFVKPNLLISGQNKISNSSNFITHNFSYNHQNKELSSLLNLVLAKENPLLKFQNENISLRGEIDIKTNLNNLAKSSLVVNLDSIEWKAKLDRLTIKSNIDNRGNLSLVSSIFSKNSTLNIYNETELFTKNWSLNKKARFNLSLNSQNFDLADFLEDVSGKIEFKATASGQIGGDIAADVKLQSQPLTIYQEKIDTLNLSLSTDGKKVVVDSLLIGLYGGLIKGSADLTDFNKYLFKLTAQELDLKRVNALNHVDLRGKLSLDFTGEGALDNPFLKGKISVDNGGFNEHKFNNFVLDINLMNQQVNINGDFGFKLEARADLKKSSYQAKVNFSNYDFSTLVPPISYSWRADLNGNILCAGNWLDKPLSSLSLKVDSLDITLPEKKVLRQRGLDISYQNELWSIKNGDFNLFNSGFLTLNGHGDISGDNSLSATLSLETKELEFLAEELVGISGKIGANINLVGALDRYKYSGAINLKQISLPTLPNTQKVTNLNGQISLNNTLAVIDNLDGSLDDGRFEIKGSADILDFKLANYNLLLSGYGLPIKVPEHLNSKLNCQLSYQNQNQQSKLSGNIDLLDFLYYKDIELLDNLFFNKGAKSITPSVSDSPDNFNLEVRLKSNSAAIIENDLLYLKVIPDINLTGSLHKLNLEGRAVVVPGSFVDFTGNQYMINRGVLDFSPHLGFYPDLDLESRVDLKSNSENYKIKILAQGNLKEPQLSMSSQPTENEADIISLLLTGQKIRDWTNSNSTPGNREKMAMEILLNHYRDDISQKTGLDYLSFGLNDDFSATKGSGYDVTVGKQISERLLVKYSLQNDNNLLKHTMNAEYQLLEFFFLNGYQSSDGTFGGELKLRKEFR